MKFLKKILDKIIMEMRCYREDNTAFRRLACVTCFEMYPPSFYIRYTPEEQKVIHERNIKEIQEMLEIEMTEERFEVKRGVNQSRLDLVHPVINSGHQYTCHK